ncbi:DUF4843 domain-containing protein [Sphingobacterium bovistauri]|uniref:DUF4843 domain-containing protein n=1 Tax=Sphingobacterium bovistauri TaxID=2781959 RepID=A0ABS7ZCS7_9SPHI|nr:DUF4843 domain-containing protein [Sphingobacterium bovistauri]MCA5006685.1 DUF4843 domain-containing protein [Sphingobacterium bovistauri]
MNKNIFYILAILVCFNVYSCSKSDLITYDGERLLVFFNPAKEASQSPIDSVVFKFGLLPIEITDTLISYPVKLVGKKLDKPTPFIVMANKSATTGVENKDFIVQAEHSFPSDTVIYNLPIRIFRPSSANSKFKITLELPQTENFNNDAFKSEGNKKESNRVVFYVTDELIIPANWTISGSALGANFHLGPFSRKKLQLISKIVITRSGNDVFTPDLILSNVATNSGNITTFGTWLNEYLVDQAKKGTPVLDEDGGLMKAGDKFK